MTGMPASSSGAAYCRTASWEAASITASGFSATSASSEVTNGIAKARRERLPPGGFAPAEDAGDLDRAELGAMLEDEARDDAAADDADAHAGDSAMRRKMPSPRRPV